MLLIYICQTSFAHSSTFIYPDATAQDVQWRDPKPHRSLQPRQISFYLHRRAVIRLP